MRTQFNPAFSSAGTKAPPLKVSLEPFDGAVTLVMRVTESQYQRLPAGLPQPQLKPNNNGFPIYVYHERKPEVGGHLPTYPTKGKAASSLARRLFSALA